MIRFDLIGSWSRKLLRGLVQQLAFVDDVHGDELERLVSHNLESGVWRVSLVDKACSGNKLYFLAVGRLHRRVVEDVSRLFAVMEMPRDKLARRILVDREDNLHICAGQIGALEFLAGRRILRLRQADQRGGGNNSDGPFASGSHFTPPFV
jgi:hypothetical protein